MNSEYNEVLVSDSEYIAEIRSALGHLREPIKFVDRLPPRYHDQTDLDREVRGLKMMHTLRQQICKISKNIVTEVRLNGAISFLLPDLLSSWDLLRSLDLERTMQVEVEADAGQEIAECLYFTNLWPKVAGTDSYNLDLEAELKKFKGLEPQAKIAGLADVATEIGKAVTEEIFASGFDFDPDHGTELKLKLRTIYVIEEILGVLTDDLYGIPPNVINNSHRLHQGLRDKIRTIRGFLARLKEGVIALRREMFLLKKISSPSDEYTGPGSEFDMRSQS